MEYRIRPAVASDIEGILALDRASESLPHWAEAEYLAAIGQQGTENTVCRGVFVAESSSDIVGLAVVSIVTIGDEVHSELESVAVAQHWLRRGIGQTLCRQGIDWARTKGAISVELEVRSQSVGAIALYQGMGFIAEGRRTGYYRNPVDDAVLMRLDLI